MSKKTVAIVGASSNRSKFSNKSLRAHLLAGYTVYPVHPKETEIEGLPVYASILDVPGDLDRISVYLPPAIGIAELPHYAQKHPKEVWLNPGTESPSIMETGKQLGLPLIASCSIVDLGMSPSQFDE